MAEYREVVHERLYLKVPGGEQLRKTSAGRLKHMLATGWRETQRWEHPEHVTLRLERSGHAPTMKILPKPPAPPPRAPRQGGPRGGFNRGGPRGPRSGPGGQGGPGGAGPGGRSAPASGAPAAPAQAQPAG